MMREIALAATVVLLCASAGSGDHPRQGDYELRTPTESIKVKSAQACLDGQRAIARGWIKSIPANTPTICFPHPDFFTPRENCVPGFNCPDR